MQVGGKKLHIEDMTGKEVAMVHQKLLSLRPKFFILKDGRQVAEIVKKITLFKPKYVIAGPDWKVKGSLLKHDYVISDKTGAEVVRVHKVWFSWGDSYELDISERADKETALAVVLAIDCVMADEAEARQMSVENS